MSILYLVATPIGNLEDISARALRILAEVKLIAAEDTRQTQKLLQRYEIKTPCISYHEHNKISRVEDSLDALGGGDVALVSDAGMPGLNDPGYELVQAALKAVDAEFDHFEAVGRGFSEALAQLVARAAEDGMASLAAVPFLLGGGLKIVYDLLLLRSFRQVKPPEEARPRDR